MTHTLMVVTEKSKVKFFCCCQKHITQVCSLSHQAQNTCLGPYPCQQSILS
uniref:Uncharacterized protein n=1 Tax=Anguilla anguilla TaxID=7936 RepID=A0A0E9SU67_ANGAN